MKISFFKNESHFHPRTSYTCENAEACKVLREAKCESALINQFLRSGTSIVRIFVKHFMLMARRILWQSYISR